MFVDIAKMWESRRETAKIKIGKKSAQKIMFKNSKCEYFFNHNLNDVRIIKWKGFFFPNNKKN